MYRGPVIDVDVHHTWVSPQDVVEYLPQEWREYVAGPGDGRAIPVKTLNNWLPHTWGTNKRLDAFPTEGPPGSDYELVRTQVLDPLRIEHALLTYDIGDQSGLANPYFAAAVCRAVNEWSLDRWLSGTDSRLMGALLVPTELPDEAAVEIRRMGADSRMAAVLVVGNALGKPFGHPVYHPIYEAAAEMGLPVAFHVGGEQIGRGSHTSAGGLPSSRLEMFALLPQPGMHHVASFVTHGVFEKYPSLRILMTEHGISWIPMVLWNLDSRYAMLRRESPWVKRLPSEYIMEHVWFSTQPIDAPDRRGGGLVQMLRSYDGIEDRLCFATDYPHWDADEPNQVAAILPTSWQEKICYGNARQLFGDRLTVNGASVSRPRSREEQQDAG